MLSVYSVLYIYSYLSMTVICLCICIDLFLRIEIIIVIPIWSLFCSIFLVLIFFTLTFIFEFFIDCCKALRTVNIGAIPKIKLLLLLTVVYQSRYLAAALSVALHMLQEQVATPVYQVYLAYALF